MRKLTGTANIILLGAICLVISFDYARKNYEQKFSTRIFESEFKRFTTLSEGTNNIVHLPLADSRNNPGSLMSPDALFSMMSFDLSEKPVGLYLPLPLSPWTITIYEEHCNAFYSLDERTFEADYLQAVLYREGQSAPQNDGAVNIKSPGMQGIIITRLILPGIQEQPGLAELRKEMRSGLMGSN